MLDTLNIFEFEMTVFIATQFVYATL